MRSLVAMFAVASIATAACGSAGDHAGSPASSTIEVPSGATVASLTPAQATQFCSDLQTWAADSGMKATSLELGCKLQGTLAVADPRLVTGMGGKASDTPAAVAPGSEPATCRAAYLDCKNKQAQGGSAPTSLTDRCAPDPTCNATVGEIKACLTSVSSKLGEMTAAMPSCDTITSQSANDSLMTMLTYYSQMTSGDCAPVATKCASMNPLNSIKAPTQ